MGVHGKISVTTPVILAIENSGMCGSVALVSPGHCIGEYSLQSSRTHSKRLLAAIDTLMHDAEITWEEIDGLAVSLGPGSFTGLRIGLSTAKGLAMATGKNLLGVSTLAGLAGQFAFSPGLICPVVDARKKEVYAGFYRCGPDGGVKQLTDIMALSPTELVKKITEPTVLVGDGVVVYGDLFKKALGESALMAPPELHFARAASIGMLAVSKWRRNEFLDPATAVPLYVRKSDAELNLGEPKGKRKSG